MIEEALRQAMENRADDASLEQQLGCSITDLMKLSTGFRYGDMVTGHLPSEKN